MEIILSIEIIASLLLLCVLLVMMLRSRSSKSRSGRNRNANAGAGARPGPVGQGYAAGNQGGPYVPSQYAGMGYGPGYPAGGYGNMQYNAPPYANSHSYYVNTGYGAYPTYQDPARTYIHRGAAYTDLQNGYYEAGSVYDRTIPARAPVAPVSGMDETLYSFQDNNFSVVGGADKAAKGETGRFDAYGSPSSGAENIVSDPNTRWQVDFMEMSSGRHVLREFSQELVVGRQMPAPMETGRLYLSMDATVSRSQFCLYSTNKGIMIENLSTVNITRKNGRPLWQPVLLEEGDILELGRMRYMVKGIRRAA